MKTQVFLLLAFVCVGEVVHYSEVLKAFEPRSGKPVIAIFSLPLTKKLKEKLKTRLLKEKSDSARNLKARLGSGKFEVLEPEEHSKDLEDTFELDETSKDLEDQFEVEEPEIETLADELGKASFFPASYARWLEEAGAMVIPLEFHLDSESLKAILKKTDGLLLTGGASPLFSNKAVSRQSEDLSSALLTRVPSLYSQKAAELLNFAEELNKAKRYPVWGTCLGFEAMVLREGAFKFPFNMVHNINVNSPIDFVEPPKPSESSGFGNAAKELLGKLTPEKLKTIRSKKMFYFNHDNAFLIPEYDGLSALKNNYDILASARAANKNIASPFVAVIAHKTFPFFGVQFHPEKTKFESFAQNGLEEKQTAEEISLLFGRFFVDLAEKYAKESPQRNLRDSENPEHNFDFEVSSVSKVGSFDKIYVFTRTKRILI